MCALRPPVISVCASPGPASHVPPSTLVKPDSPTASPLPPPNFFVPQLDTDDMWSWVAEDIILDLNRPRMSNNTTPTRRVIKRTRTMDGDDM